jgi:outer membrane lipoprotein SlyB
MRHYCIAVAATLALVSPSQVLAQPAPEGGPSVVMRCRDCGVIQSVRETQRAREGAVSGVSNAGPIGLVINIPTGSGGGGEQPFVGAVGSREWQQLTTSTSYEFTVRMDDGAYRLAHKDGVSDLRVGERVRVLGDGIQRWTAP